MAGYSATPLVKKLGIGPASRVAFVGAPPGFSLDGVRPRARGAVDVALLFVRSPAELERGFGKIATRVDSAGAVWVVWPKKTSKLLTDVSENVLRDHVLRAHPAFVDVKVCAVDETWSGLRFVRRLSHR